MPTLHLKNDSKTTIPIGGKVGRILAGAARSIKLTSSEIEDLRPKLERFVGKLSYWTDVESHIQEDVAKRISDKASRIFVSISFPNCLISSCFTLFIKS